MTTSNKVKCAIIEQGRKKKWIAEQLGISRPALDSKLNDNFWSIGEIIKLKSLGLIN